MNEKEIPEEPSATAMAIQAIREDERAKIVADLRSWAETPGAREEDQRRFRHIAHLIERGEIGGAS